MLNGRARVILRIDLMNTAGRPTGRVTYPGKGIVEGVRRRVIAGRCIPMRGLGPSEFGSLYPLDRRTHPGRARARPHHRVIPQRHIDCAILRRRRSPATAGPGFATPRLGGHDGSRSRGRYSVYLYHRRRGRFAPGVPASEAAGRRRARLCLACGRRARKSFILALIAAHLVIL